MLAALPPDELIWLYPFFSDFLPRQQLGKISRKGIWKPELFQGAVHLPP